MPKILKTMIKLNAVLQSDVSIAEEFLGLQEVSSNLWQAVAARKSKKEQERRLASVAIAIMLISHKLHLENTDATVERRLRELVKNKAAYKHS